MTPDIKQILRHYPDAIIARGHRYLRSGHVLSTTLREFPFGIMFSGDVEGSGGNVYDVALTFDHSGKLLNSFCSCPMAGSCKHEVAVLLGWQEQMKGGADNGSNVAPHEVQAGRDWLMQLQEELKRGEITPPECLVYVLKASSRKGSALSLQVFKTRRLQKGGYARLASYRNYDQVRLNHDRPAFVQEGDVAVLLALRMHDSQQGFSFYGDEFALSDSSGYRLVMAALDTGRCYWQDTDNHALQWGESCKKSFAWKEENGRLGATLADWPPHWRLINTSPPLALDVEGLRVHPLDTGLPNHVVDLLLKAPALRPQVWGTVWPLLRETFSKASLPLPKQVQAPREINDLLPQPHLHFYTDKVMQGRHSLEIHRASLRAVYGEAEVAGQEPGEFLSVMKAGENLVIRRELGMEGQWLAALPPLLPVSSMPDRNVPRDERRHDFGLRDESDWPRYMQQHLPRFVDSGWQVSFSDDFPWRLQDLEAAVWYGDLSDGPDRNGWFSLGLGVEIDGEKISLVPLLVTALERMSLSDRQQLMQEEGPAFLHVLHEQQVLKAPTARLRPLLEVLMNMFGRVDQARPISKNGDLRLHQLEAARLAATTDVPWKNGADLRELGAKLENFSGLDVVPVPAAFKAQLRPYQQSGLDWLQFLCSHQFGGVLADDMGLGKTIQTLAHIAVEKEQGRLQKPALIVCPKSLLPNWRAEAARFAPGLRVLCIVGTQRDALLAQMHEHDLVITTYPLLARDMDTLIKQKFSMCVCDEAQQLKNHKTQMAHAVRHINAGQRLALTGTPMENHLGELWSLFDWLQPGYLGNDAEFRRHFRHPVEKNGDRQAAQRLSRRIKPFMLRRTKQDVATELPPKTEILQTVEVVGAQRDLYETVRATMDKKVREVIAKKGLARSSIEILEALLKLRQVCCDPRLLGETGSKAGSAKLALLLDLLPEMIEDGRRILLFSQFTSMLALIEVALKARGIDYVKLTGQTRDREAPVTRFQQGEVPLFLISLKAGGSGLNLTAADTVIHYDPWWNPAVEQQATDRAHRIGQDKPVFVYKLICEGTLEERMLALQARKAALAQSVYDGAGTAGGLLGADDLRELFRPLGE